MSIIPNTVLLLKSEKSDGEIDKYEDLLRLNKFEVILVKTLNFQYKNEEILKEKLLKPDNYSGLIFSSPRCVAATSQVITETEIRPLWGRKWNFCVGETTFRHVFSKLGLECKGKESGNAKNLAQIITEDTSKFDKPFLFPHGNLKTDTLQLELNKVNLAIEYVLVYETLPNPAIQAELAAATNNFTEIPEFVVFFSPSGFNSSIQYLRQVPVDFGQVKLIAIGPVTQLALENDNLKVWKTATSPTPEEIMNAIQL